ncbi:MAG: nitrate reductase cytochrome c-type subunit [Betaproteobacteria bacterium]|nr:nitrate reductase cytochrome c-type subunit [Betaproteobacteria bacterium]
MNMSIKVAVVAAVAATVYGCAQFAGVATLRGTDTEATDTAPTDFKTYAGKRPGSGAPITRTFKEQPPLIPHAIDNFDEITLDDNQCLECHSPATAAAKKAPKVADSHMQNGEVLKERYQCNTCHVPQVDAPPLIANTFVGTPVPQKQ